MDFSCGVGTWTDNPDEALDLIEVVWAVNYALRHGIDEVRVVIQFKDSRYDIFLPVLHAVA